MNRLLVNKKANMKYFLVLTLSMITIFCSCSTHQSIVHIPANQSLEIDYPEYQSFKATLKNKSAKGFDIAVLSKENNQQIKGFGIGTKGKADVIVEAANKLVFQNTNNTPVALTLAVNEVVSQAKPVITNKNKYISFTLRNNGAKSIPLIIPTVMNPNLSPFSKSGVDLKVGQEILFKVKGKKYVLLTVDESIKDGDELDVGKLLKERKRELGLE